MCGQLFMPRSSRQHFCRRAITKKCLICGDEFETNCSPDGKLTCDKLECKKQGKQVSEPVERVCRQCGNKFTTVFYKQFYCNEEKEKACEVCGKTIRYECNSFVPATCSASCQAALVKAKRTEGIADETRICKFCGKQFYPREIRDVYCYDQHYKNCVICGKAFKFDPRGERDSDHRTCSKECMGKLMSQNHDYTKGAETYKKNMLEKYGVENSMQLPESKDKIVATNLEKYGTEWYMQSDEYKEAIKKTSQEKYGVDHFLQSPEVIEKRLETVQKKYRVDNVFQSGEIKEKIKQTNLEKYGVEFAIQSKEMKEVVKANNIARYGVAHPMMLPEFKEKAMQTNLEKFGRRAVTQQHIEDIQTWYQFIDSPREFIKNHYVEIPTVHQLALDLGVERSAIDYHLEQHDAVDCIRRSKSMMEEDIFRILKEADPTIRIVVRTKSIISPYELDLYLPDYKLGIECNPTATHNSSVPDPWGTDPKPYNYHKMKTDLCEQQSISLFHIFGFDWSNKRTVIESILRNKIGKSKRVVYARKCKIIEVAASDAIAFLNQNHRQGAANSPIRLGLELDGELISLMTFGKMRRTIGTGNESLEDCYELVRFCSSLNTSVVGGASKLLKHFIRVYEPKRIRSFSDRAHTSGDLYKTLGFKEVRRSDAGYVWVDVVTDIAYHRVNAQKQNLKKFLKDTNIDLNQTEKQIMIEHGYVQVFDSGTITWELALK